MKQWYSLSAVKVIKKLYSDMNTGLDHIQAEKMKELYGENRILKPKISSLKSLFFKELKHIWSIIIILTSGLLFYVGEKVAFFWLTGIFGIMLMILVFLKCKEERKLKTIEKLNSSYVKVIRGGNTFSINAEELVVGDIIYIEQHKYVPADVRLIECNGLKINELAVTGENYEVEKYTAKIEETVSSLSEIKNMAFKSTVVTKGEGLGVVVAVGMSSQIGNIISVLNNYKKDSTCLIDKLRDVLDKMTIGMLSAAILVSFVELILKVDINYWIRSMANVFVVGTPIQGVILIFLFLFYYSRYINKEGIHLKNISSIDLLSRTTLFLTDKVGVYSYDEMILNKIYADGNEFNISGKEKIKKVFENNSEYDTGEDLDIIAHSTLYRLFQIVLLCNDSKYSKEDNESIGDNIEIGFIKFAQRNLIYKSELDREFPRVLEIPYDTDKRIKTTLNKVEENYRANTVGAVDSILNRCTHILRNGVEVEITGEDIENIKKAAFNMAKKGLKAIAASSRSFNYMPTKDENIESNMVFVGMIGLINPLKVESYDAIRFCARNNIKTIICMDDNKITSSAIGRELKVIKKGETVLSGVELDFMGEDEFNRTVYKKKVYSKVDSKQKARIINSLKKRGYKITSLGTKLTDLPYMRISNLSMAAGAKCSGIIKSLSDIFMKEINIIKILDLFKKSRQIMNSLKNVVSYLLTCSTAGCTLILLSLILSQKMPLNIYQIMWINTVVVGISSIALLYRYEHINNNFNESNNEISKYSSEMKLLNEINVNNSVLKGVVIGIISYIGFAYGLRFDLNTARTISFAVIGIGEILFLLNYSGENIIFNDLTSNLLKFVNLLLLALLLSVPVKFKIFDLIKMNNLQWGVIGLLSIVNLILILLLKPMKTMK